MTIAIALDGKVGDRFSLQVSFEVPSHGITALLGPSGSGKTSILRALAGLERIAGSICFNGQTWQDGSTFLPSESRGIGYIFQGEGLLPHLSIAGNLDYAARRASSGPFDRTDIIRRTGIADLLGQRPSRLSGGEAQRAGIARALISQPRLLLMDEPLSGLDSDARTEMVEWLQALLGEIDIPVLYVTHDHGEAARLAVRTIHILNGRAEG